MKRVELAVGLLAIRIVSEPWGEGKDVVEFQL
jgi:hypothetical protein